MARGQPDFGAYAATAKLAGMSDMAELAVRLGSLVAFDRRGRVVILDDFEAPVLKWYALGASGGAAILDGTYPQSGSQDCKLSVANSSGSTITMSKGFNLLPSKRLGIEISFCRPRTDMYFTFSIDRDDGTNRYLATIRVDPNGRALAYKITTGTYTEFATSLLMYNYAFFFHHLKLVADFDTNNYARCIYAGIEYDLSSYGLEVTASSGYPHCRAKLELFHRAQAAIDLYVDDFILTQEEP